MNEEKRWPTLDELKSFPRILWELELSQIWVDALDVDQEKIAEMAGLMLLDPHLTPEMVVELRAQLRCETGFTLEECEENYEVESEEK